MGDASTADLNKKPSLTGDGSTGGPPMNKGKNIMINKDSGRAESGAEN